VRQESRHGHVRGQARSGTVGRAMPIRNDSVDRPTITPCRSRICAGRYSGCLRHGVRAGEFRTPRHGHSNLADHRARPGSTAAVPPADVPTWRRNASASASTADNAAGYYESVTYSVVSAAHHVRQISPAPAGPTGSGRLAVFHDLVLTVECLTRNEHRPRRACGFSTRCASASANSDGCLRHFPRAAP
jgi:hypothetical protein